MELIDGILAANTVTYPSIAQLLGKLVLLYEVWKPGKTFTRELYDLQSTYIAGHDLDRAQNIANALKALRQIPSNSTVAFVDGSSLKNPGWAGAGAWIVNHSTLLSEDISQPLGLASNNVAEMYALILVADVLQEKKILKNDLVICTDSTLVFNVLTRGWQLRGHHKLHRLVHKKIHDLRRNWKIKFLWVPAHAGIQGNKRADKLAMAAAKKRTGLGFLQRLLDGFSLAQLEFTTKKPNRETTIVSPDKIKPLTVAARQELLVWKKYLTDHPLVKSFPRLCSAPESRLLLGIWRHSAGVIISLNSKTWFSPDDSNISSPQLNVISRAALGLLVALDMWPPLREELFGILTNIPGFRHELEKKLFSKNSWRMRVYREVRRIQFKNDTCDFYFRFMTKTPSVIGQKSISISAQEIRSFGKRIRPPPLRCLPTW